MVRTSTDAMAVCIGVALSRTWSQTSRPSSVPPGCTAPVILPANVPDYLIKGTDGYRVITDERGSVRLVLKVSDGTVAQQIDYDEFGRVLTDTAPGFQPFGFAGGLYDPDTSLVRFGARDYDTQTRRWTAWDPIGFAGGQLNL